MLLAFDVLTMSSQRTLTVACLRSADIDVPLSWRMLVVRVCGELVEELVEESPKKCGSLPPTTAV